MPIITTTVLPVYKRLVKFFEATEMHAPSVNRRDIKLLYAGDVIIFSETGVGLQRGLKRLEEYCGI